MFKKIAFGFLLSSLFLLIPLKAQAQYLCGGTGLVYSDPLLCQYACGSSCEELTATTTGSSGTCDTTDYEGFVYDSQTGFTYAMSKSQNFWTNWTNLATIQNSTDNTALNQIMTYYSVSNAWIGAYDPSMSSAYNTNDPQNYVWQSTGTAVSSGYNNWASGQPNNALYQQDIGVIPSNLYGEHWAEMESNGTWNDEGYHYNFPSSQGYAPYYNAFVQWSGPLSCVDGTTPPSTSTGSTQTQLISTYCNNTTPCYLCTDSTTLSECQSGNTYPTGTAYLCPAGQTQCSKNEISGTPQCPSGYTLQNGECVSNIAPSCPGGYTFSNGECVEKTSPSCPSGYTETNGQCQQGNVGGSVWNIWGQELLYTSGNCISGDGFWVGSVCFNTSNNTFGGTVAYDNGYLYTNMYSGSGSGITGDGGYWKESGYISYKASNNTFSGSIYSPYGNEYITGNGNCLDFSGEGISGSNQVCMSLNTTAMSCPSGYALENGECVGTASPYCSKAGYSLTNADNTCTSSITPTYTCPSGTTLVNNQCVSYSCPLGGSTQCIEPSGSSTYYCSPNTCNNVQSGGQTVTNPAPVPSQTNNGTVTNTGCVGQVYIFSGQAYFCKPAGLQTGGTNCCQSTKDWFGLGSCDASEQKLAQLRSDYECNEVGTYCSESFLGICLQTMQSWCCFGGELAELVQVQVKGGNWSSVGFPSGGGPGEVQPWVAGTGFGSPDSPNCSGFTPTQFQNIDFSQVNLKPFYANITTSAAANATGAVNSAESNFSNELTGSNP